MHSLVKLRRVYSGPVLHKILVFGTPPDHEACNPDVIFIPSSRISTITSLGTIMCDLTSDFLAELSILASARQVAPFKSPGLKELDVPVKTQTGFKTFKVSLSRRDSGASLHSPTKSSSSGLSRKPTALSLSLSDKTKARQRGRMLKYVAGMYLIAGHWQDALREFTDAAISLKTAHDFLWLASALEGISVCLVLLSFLEIPVPIPTIALDLLPYSQAIEVTETLAATMSLLEFITDNTGSVLKYYSRSQGSPEESVPQTIYCETVLRYINFLTVIRLGGGWNPASINALVRDVDLPNNVTTASPSISTIVGWCNKVYATELHNLPMLSQFRIYGGLSSIYARNDLVRKRTFILREMLANLVKPLRRNNAINPGISHEYQNLRSLLDSLEPVFGIETVGFGWEKLRVSFLKTALELSEALDDYPGTIKYAGQLLSTSADVLNQAEQFSILRSIDMAAEKARRDGQGNLLSEYWDQNLLREITFLPSNTSIQPVKVTKKSTHANVFLHNPFEKKPAAKELALVEKERSELVISLQNPFAFEVHIKKLEILTNDDEIVLQRVLNLNDIYIAPMSVFDLKFPVIPVGSGTLVIKGCKIQVANCEMKEFYLKKPTLCQNDKVKSVGLVKLLKNLSTAAAATTIQDEKLDVKTDNDSLNLTPQKYVVIPQQPILAYKETSLDQDWAILLEGERQRFTLTVSNLSPVAAENVVLKLTDSITENLKHALQRKGLSAREIYDLEHALFEQQQPLKWIRNDVSETVSVPGYGQATFEIEITGRHDLEQAFVGIEYTAAADETWIRTLTVPINLTVTPSVELVNFELLPLQPNGNAANPELFRKLDPIKHCLLVLDVLNHLPTTAVDLRFKHAKGRTQQRIKPTCTARILVPIITTHTPSANDEGGSATEDNAALDAPIPSIVKTRQFVVDATLSSPEAALLARNVFWIREAILKQLQHGLLDWTTAVETSDDNNNVDDLFSFATEQPCETPRAGMLDLRAAPASVLTIDKKAVSLFRPSLVALTMTVEPATSTANGSAKANLTLSNHTYTIKVDLHNKLPHDVSGFVRVIPVHELTTDASSPAGAGAGASGAINTNNTSKGGEYIYNGCLQRPVVRVPAGASRTVFATGFVFLDRGRYQFTSAFEMAPSSSTEVATVHSNIFAQRGSAVINVTI